MAATADVLTLFRELVVRPRKMSSPEIMMVAMDSLESDLDLIRAIARHSGAPFLVAGEHASGTVGQTSAVLTPVITAALQLRKPGGTTESLEVHASGTRVNLTIDGQSASASSLGLNERLGIATSLLSAELEDVDCAFVSYNEDLLDEAAKAAAWKLFTQALDGVPIGGLSRLVVLVQQTDINYGLHCGRGTSLSLRLTVEGVQRRKSWGTSDVAVTRLAEPRRSQCLVLLLGAGFSYSSGLPLGDELRDSALQRMLGASDAYPALADRFRAYVEEERRLLTREEGMSDEEFRSSLTLERVMREELYHTRAEDSPTLRDFSERAANAISISGRAVSSLGKMMESRRSLVIVTVNFDQLIEHQGNVKVFRTDAEFDEFESYLMEYAHNGGDVPLLKLHGSIELPDTIVANVDRVAEGLQERKVDALRRIITLFNTHWAYVGYSMRDFDVTAVLSLQEFWRHTSEYWVSPFPAPTAERFASAYRAWEGEPKFSDRTIDLTADVFMERLSELWHPE